MSLVVVGLNERDVPLALIEQVALDDTDLDKALDELVNSPHLDEAVVVSTCMRTEVYALAERFHDGLADIRAFFGGRVGEFATDRSLLDDALLVAFDDAAAVHLFEVAAGIDSAVLGEGEILRQVRHAAEVATATGACGPVLSELFRHAIEVGKRARTETAIARGTTSLAHVAVAVARRELGESLKGRRVVVVGAGDMGEGIATALAKDAPDELVVANRTLSSAEALCARLGSGRPVPLALLAEELKVADAGVFATASPHFQLSSELVEAVVAAREDRLVLVDAALPRDVDPDAANVDGVSLFDLDDLRAYVDEEMAGRRAEVARVADLIVEELTRYKESARSRSFGPLVTRLYAAAEEVRLDVLSSLGNLSESEQALLERETRKLVRRLLHKPVVELKSAAGTPRGERLAEALRALFEL